MPKRLTYVFVVLGAWLLGLAWALSSPVGSSPDDDFHLTSIWCATENPDACVEKDATLPEISAEVPSELLGMRCYAGKSEISGACSEPASGGTANSTWFNVGSYPPTFYSVMSWFVGPDVDRSVLVMRLVALTVGLLTLGLAAWAAPTLRDSQVVAWAVTSVPLWMFFMPSTNPTSWGTVGVVALFPATYALLTREGAQARALAGFVVALAAVLATSRADTSAMGIAVIVLTAACYLRTRAQLVAAVVLFAALLFLAAGIFLSGQSTAWSEGLSGEQTDSGLSLLARNLASLPDIWIGVFGATFGLGWIDTVMPSSVWVPALFAASGLFLIGLYRVGWRRGFLLVAFAGMLVVLPLVILQRSGASVGTGVQPRYIMPVLIVLMAVALAPLDGERISLGPVQRWLLTACGFVATSIALHYQLRRYVTGTDENGANLNSGAEWSYGHLLSPMGVWALGTIAAGLFFFAVFRLLPPKPQPVAAPELASVDRALV